MGLVNWFKGKSGITRTGYAVFLLIFLILAAWVIIFAYGMIDVSPDRFGILKEASPKIRADWTYAFGASLEKADVKLDGKDISTDIKLLPRGFIFDNKEDLSEGEHIVEAKLTYSLFYRKTVKVKWRFTTDTTPPQIEFSEGGSTMLATSQSSLSLNGMTEPFSEMKFRLNGKSIFGSQVGEDGRFKVKISPLNQKNELVVMAVDRAGNVSKIKLPVVVDKNSPSIDYYSPAPNSVVYGTDVVFAFKLSEKDSEIGSVTLNIDGKNIPIEPTKRGNEIKKEVQLFSDGAHKAILTVKDAAGNYKDVAWNFKLETTKVLVDKSERTLYVYKKGKVVATFRVAVGQPSYPTPAGHWKAVSKVSMPTWRNPGSDWAKEMPPSIPPGPGNPLGLRAIYLNAEGIRIHGTNKLGSIGTPASHGCIRVYNPEIVRLYPLIPIGAPVDIVE